MKKYPIGIQDFPLMIKEGFLYVDKTELIYRLITTGVSYFLARPRRFGKSLLVSTLESIFKGEKELFSNLWIDSSDYEWREFPVIRLDLSKTVSSSHEALSESLQELLQECANKYGITGIKRSFPSLSLSALVIELSKRSPVVILIDEYDKPLVHQLDNMKIVAQNREILSEFYTTIKALSEYIHRVFITGVSKFSKVSLFSGMNNLIDISMRAEYSTLLGLTEGEIHRYFKSELDSIAGKRQLSTEDLLQKIKYWYNGYFFSRSNDAEKVYNPLSLMQFLQGGEFDNYWFTTATPTFAINLIKKSNYFIPDLEKGIIAGKEIETSHETDVIDLPTLLFQTGYLTIDRYDANSWTYFLKFPNEEVKRSFLDHLLYEFAEMRPSEVHTFLFKLSAYLSRNDLNSFFETFNNLLGSIPYHIHIELEAYYHSLLYLVLKALGFTVEAEVITNRGRTDMVLKTEKCIFVFEFKINSNAQTALNQILQKKYYEQYRIDTREIILVGVNFDTKMRSLNDWKSQSILSEEL
jgi:hypothetical protein